MRERTPFELRCDEAWEARDEFALGISLYVYRRDREICDTAWTNLYVVHDPVADAIKIGTTKTPRPRISNLAVGNPNPIETVVVVPAPAGLERALHQFLADHRIRGEWFATAPQVLIVCELLLSAGDFHRDAEATSEPDEKPDAELTVEVFCNRANELLDYFERAAA